MSGAELMALDDARRVSVEWCAPDMSVMTGHRTPAPALPLDVFGGWRQFLLDAAESRAVPVDYIAAGLLASAATLIGNTRRASPWAGWEGEPTILWLGLVGGPSSGKSPALDVTMDLLGKIEAEMAGDHGDTLRGYESRKQRAYEKRKQWEQEVKDATKAGKDGPDLPQDAVEPDRPERPRVVVMDGTIEAVGRILASNPRGVLHQRDELAGWLGNFDRFGGAGGDRAFWIESYGGRRHVIDRVKNDGRPLTIPALSVSIVGGIQPDKLSSTLLTGDDDGLCARMLLVWPDSVPPKRPQRIPDTDSTLRAFWQLHSIKMGATLEGEPQWKAVPFAEDAAGIFERWMIGHHHETEATGGKLAGHYGKYKGIVARLALTLEFLWWSVGADENEPCPETVTAAAVAGAIRLVEDYFKPMARRCYGDAALPMKERHGATLARWIMAQRTGKPNAINTREIYRSAGLPGLRDNEQVAEAAAFLVEAGWLRLATRRGPGRPAGDYDVNPRLWAAP